MPHPLSNFAAGGGIKNEWYVDLLVEYLNDLECADEGTLTRESARWLLFQSERTFFFACSEAGIDGERFREHLLWVERGDDKGERLCG
jgi:hypothetical protein